MISSLYLRVLFVLAVIIWAAILFVNGYALSAALLKPATLVLTSLIVIGGLFEKWIWRWKFLYPWFTDTPDLIGTYRGQLNSQWVDPSTDKPVGEIVVYFVIRQTFSAIHVRMYTEQSDSVSVSADFVKAPDGKKQLVFTYRNEPRLSLRRDSPIHYGAARVDVIEDADRLRGDYWTDRASLGEFEFARISRETPHSFEGCERLTAN